MVIYEAVNVTGWAEILNGELITAAFTMYNDAAVFGGWFICILFFVYHFMLMYKTRSLVLGLVTGIFFAAIYVVKDVSYLANQSIYFIFLILAFELAGILYMWIFK